MEKRRLLRRRMWIVAALVGLPAIAGVGLGRMEPAGRKAGLVQFDAAIELNMEAGSTNTVVFARYWVCRDYYAVAVVWCEPHGGGLMSIWRTLVVLSDKTGFRMDSELNRDDSKVNTTYPKPLGERTPLAPGKDHIVRLAEMRFADSEALSRRVYVGDCAKLKHPGRGTHETVDLQTAAVVDGVQRRLAQLKVDAKADRIESMELLDGRKQPMCKVKYAYEGTGSASELARLTAELPERTDKLAVDAVVPILSESGGEMKQREYKVTDVDHPYRKGGRTCTVAYKDVALAGQTLRLPAQVEVRHAKDKRLMRSAKLTNFQRVNLDKAGVWEAAKAFAGRSGEDRACRRLVDKYVYPRPKPFPLLADPNDLIFVRGLIAKYPVPESSSRPREPLSRAGTQLGGSNRLLQPGGKQPVTGMGKPEAPRPDDRNKPRPRDIEPGDLRTIRQLIAYYDETIFVPLTPEQESQGGAARRVVVPGKEDVRDLWGKLIGILSYHRAPALPEEEPPRMDPNDLELIRRLQGHYEKLALQEDRCLGERLKAVDALGRLDRALKDYDAFAAHTGRYLQMVDGAGLNAMYMAGGFNNLAVLGRAGQYEKASRLMGQWADTSAAKNDADAVYRFAGWDLYGKASPWAGIQLLDRFLKKPGLSPVQRYEGLALRAVALHNTDRWLADPQTADDKHGKAQVQWILSMIGRQELAGRVGPALREALAAWQSLGEARLTEARPYSTANGYARGGGRVFPWSSLDPNSAFQMWKDSRAVVEATRLQETSAQLDRAIRERTGETRLEQPKTRRPPSPSPGRRK